MARCGGSLLRGNDGDDFEALVSGLGAVTIAQLTVANGEITAHDVSETSVSHDDINRMFRGASAIIAEELGLAWLRERYDDDNPIRAKLEFLQLIRSSKLIASISNWAADRFQAVIANHQRTIQTLPESRRDQYVSLQRAGRSVQRSLMAVERRIIFPLADEAVNQRGHLYVQPGSTDDCRMVLNGWERAVLADERSRPDFLAFLRNLDRKRWALSFAYDFRGTKPGFPDFLIFRSVNGQIVTDILEPHRGEDSAAKARGLAEFSRRYGEWFGRIQIVRLADGNLKRLSLDQEDMRRAVERTESHEEFLALF